MLIVHRVIADRLFLFQAENFVIDYREDKERTSMDMRRKVLSELKVNKCGLA